MYLLETGNDEKSRLIPPELIENSSDWILQEEETTIEEKKKFIGKKVVNVEDDEMNLDIGTIIAVDIRNRYIVDFPELDNEVFCYNEEDIWKYNKLYKE